MSLLSLYKIIGSLQSFIVGVNPPFITPPPAKPTLLQYYCTTIEQHTPPPATPPFMPYTIKYWWWQYRVKAKSLLSHTDPHTPARPLSVSALDPADDAVKSRVGPKRGLAITPGKLLTLKQNFLLRRRGR